MLLYDKYLHQINQNCRHKLEDCDDLKNKKKGEAQANTVASTNNQRLRLTLNYFLLTC